MNKPLSDEDSSKLVLKHLMEASSPADSDSKFLFAAADTVKNRKTILLHTIGRTLFLGAIGAVGIILPPVYGVSFLCAVSATYFVGDYIRGKRHNKQIEKMIELGADLNEKRHVLKELNNQLQEQNRLLNEKVHIISQFETVKEEKHRVQSNLANITSYNNHLTNIIRGVNHEVSPWLGSIGNIACIAKEEFATKLTNGTLDNTDMEVIKYLDEIRKAARQAADVLVLTSKNVKKLRNWSTTKSNLLDTIRSWGQIALMEHDIKGRLNESNLIIDQRSLNFEVLHSPMLVSQIILNLVKNSIDHNEHFLDDLKVKIYGDGKNTLYIEDNGKGIPAKVIGDIFKPGVSTKKDSLLPSGLGLANTVDYCMLMQAVISVESKVGSYTKFHIRFKVTSTDTHRTEKDTEITGSRSNYYQIIKHPTNDPQADIGTDIPFNDLNIKKKDVEIRPYQRSPSCAAIEIVPIKDPGTEFKMRLTEIDETLKKLN